MPHLYRADTGQPLCTVTQEQLVQLRRALVEGFEQDTDYAIDGDTITYLLEEGVDEQLVHLIEAALASTGATGLAVSWSA